MNWAAFLFTMGGASLLATIFNGISYLGWEHPNWHKTQLTWICITMVIAALCFSIAIGIVKS